MTRKRVRRSLKINSRFIILFILILSIISTLGYTLFNNLMDLRKLNKELNNLNKKVVILKDEEDSLEADIKKLSDSSYVARYAREKYLYSKDGELIIRMDD